MSAALIGIMGETGSGKTTAMRNLDPATTLYIDCDKKGLNWKGWREQYSGEKKNYLVTDFPAVVLRTLQAVNDNEKFKHIKVVVIDTINGLMVADESRRRSEKNYDKWSDLAWAVYDILDYALTMRDGLTVVFIAHSQTDRDDSGFAFTRIKTSGRKLDKIAIESKLNTVILAKKLDDGKRVFMLEDPNSTTKVPMGAFEESMIDNDITLVIKALEEF